VASRGTLSRNTRLSIGQTAYKRFLAYQCLGIDPEKVERAPFLGTELRRIRRLAHPIRETDGTPCPPVGLLDALRFADDVDARKVLSAYTAVPKSYRRLLAPELYCHAAGVSPWRVLEIVAGVEIRMGTRASAIIAKMVMPDVVKRSIERSRKPDGFKDRELLARVTGLLPRRSGYPD